MFSKNLNTDKSCLVSTLETKLQASKGFLKTDIAPDHPAGTLDQNNCMLKTWSLHVKNARNHHFNAQIQTPAKGGKTKKGAIKKTKNAYKKAIGNVLTERE